MSPLQNFSFFLSFLWPCIWGRNVSVREKFLWFQNSWNNWDFRFLPTWIVHLDSLQLATSRGPREIMPSFILERLNLIDCYILLAASFLKVWIFLLWQRRPLFYLSFSDLLLGIYWLTEALLYGTSTAHKDIVCYNLQVVGQVSATRLWQHLVWKAHSDLNKKWRKPILESGTLLFIVTLWNNSFYCFSTLKNYLL